MSLTIASLEEGWETLSSQIAQLLFERGLNKIAFLTNADRVSRMVIIYLSWVSGCNFISHFPVPYAFQRKRQSDVLDGELFSARVCVLTRLNPFTLPISICGVPSTVDTVRALPSMGILHPWPTCVLCPFG